MTLRKSEYSTFFRSYILHFLSQNVHLILLHFCKSFAKQLWRNIFNIFGIFSVSNFAKLQKSEYSAFRWALIEAKEKQVANLGQVVWNSIKIHNTSSLFITQIYLIMKVPGSNPLNQGSRTRSPQATGGPRGLFFKIQRFLAHIFFSMWSPSKTKVWA